MILRLIFVKVDGASRAKAVETATGVNTIFVSPSQSRRIAGRTALIKLKTALSLGKVVEDCVGAMRAGIAATS